MTLNIRPAVTADAPACAGIYRPFVTDGWVSSETEPPDAGEMALRISSALATHGWVVAEDGTGLRGYAYAGPHRTRAAYATSADVTVYVRPDSARMGIGRQLYTALFQQLKAKSLHAVFAGIALPNEASIALHTAMGFEPVGVYREVGWKMGDWRDVSWWQKRLG